MLGRLTNVVKVAICSGTMALGFSSSASAYAPQYMPLIPVSDFNLLVYGSARTGVL